MAKFKIKRFMRLDARQKAWASTLTRVPAKFRDGYRKPGSMNRKK